MEQQSQNCIDLIYSLPSTALIGHRLGVPFLRSIKETIDILILEENKDQNSKPSKVLTITQSSLGCFGISGIVWDCGLLLIDFLHANLAKKNHEFILDLG